MANLNAGIQISEKTLGWLLDIAFDDRDNYLESGGGQRDWGNDWPAEARDRAEMCREIAEAVSIAGEAQRWEELAQRFEESAAGPVTLNRVRMLGRCANGSESDSGTRVHIKPQGEWTALCGRQPGGRSVGWSEPMSDPLPSWAKPCARCAQLAAKKMSAV